MTPLTVAAVAFVLSLLLFGFAFWTPIYAIPLVLVFLAGFAVAQFRRRRGASRELRDFRSQKERGTPAQEVEFTERDRQTLYERD